MTQEEKSLLLKDLCARLPYKPFAQWHHKALNKFRVIKIMKVSTYGKNIDDYHINVLCQPEPGVDYEASIVDIKPYLRPMSSMTEEEQFQLGRLLGATSYNLLKGEYSSLKELLEYVYKNHIDLFGLIPKGLALEAPEEMYK